jgi:hypothetical protein
VFHLSNRWNDFQDTRGDHWVERMMLAGVS